MKLVISKVQNLFIKKWKITKQCSGEIFVLTVSEEHVTLTWVCVAMDMSARRTVDMC
jgi:hypothetical protein